MGSKVRAEKESRKTERGRLGRAGGEAGLGRKAVEHARDAVSALASALGGKDGQEGALESAVSATLAAAALGLLESQREKPGPLLSLIRSRRDEKRGGRRLWEFLREAKDRKPVLSEGPIGRGIDKLSETGPPGKDTEPLFSFLEFVCSAGETGCVWEALRVLGDVYEASLGWELSPGGLRGTSRRVKAQGAVYTPRPVARLIVERTLGPLLSGCESPEVLRSIPVLDPACGGGAFLIEVMRLFEEEAHRRGWLNREDPSEVMAWRRRVVSGALNGVDIDPAAVQLSRLALWVASGGGEEAAEAVSRSIRTGDALVGAWQADLGLKAGFEADRAVLRRSLDDWCQGLLPQEAQGPFVHWELDFPDRFSPDVLGPEGWAAVVGNPPYLKARSLRPLAPYLKARFPETYTGYNDLSSFFFHRGMELLREGGRLGFIAPAYWFQNTYGQKLRRYLLEEGRLEEVLDFGPHQVFPGRGVHTAIVFLAREPVGGRRCHSVRYRLVEPEELESPKKEFLQRSERVPKRSLRPERWVFASVEVDGILHKAQRRGRPLGELFHIEKGPTSGCNGIFTLDYNSVKTQQVEVELLRPCIKNGEIRRYGPLKPKRWLLYLDNEVEIERYPRAESYLKAHRSALASRNEARRGLYPWWRLERPRKRRLFEASAKLVVPYRAPENRFTLDEAGCFNDGGDIRVLVPRAGIGRQTMLAALAVANSAVGNMVYHCLGKPKGRMLEFFVKPLSQAPLGPPPAAWTEGAEAQISALLADEGPQALVGWIKRTEGGFELITPALALLAERMLGLHRDGRPVEEAASVDEAIDSLVGRLFGLTKREKARVAEATRASL
jgi:hypothetical protein